ncbi:MAG TPA: hypothetical protein PLH67_06100 [Lentisphaeria bacterium]|nr:hypothetical protein [Lentisphaeria bacterium]
MLEITNIRQGAVLTHFHGRETADSLTVSVEGICDHGGAVLVNGIPAICSGRRFIAPVPLTAKFNAITATAASALGEYSQKIKVVWDKQSFKRFNFYIDDNIFLFTDLATQRLQHAFDHFYLKRLKQIHQQWGLKVTLNCFYHNAHQEFTLEQMPDCYKQEFIDQSDWLKFSFHSRSEFPVRHHLIRICGEESFIAPINVHWGALQPSCAEEFIRRGSPCSTCTMRPFVSGGPSSAARLGKKNDIAGVQQSSALIQGAAFGAEYFNRPEEDSYLLRERKYYNFELGVFIARGAVCCNLVPLQEIPARLKNYFALAAETGNEVFGAASHEQYSFPYYSNYLPDHLDRIELTVKLLVEHGCKPVFFSQGLMGNLAWDK